MHAQNYWFLIVLTVVVVAGISIENWFHRRNLSRIPVRIHVNGTRGKSSVTRLIAAGLREAGITTCAKTTGTLPRMILPDGTEYPIFRPAEPNVIEQLRIVSVAAAQRADALVVECMALQPVLQWLSERKLIKATHAVITNARADHLDVMGPGERDVALALAGMIPQQSKLFTAERRHQDVLKEACGDRGSTMIAISEDEIAAVTPAELAKFAYIEHAENVALALRVCTEMGVDRDTALRGMWRAQPDPGVMTMHQLDFFGRRIQFVNGFAANDAESTERIWNLARERFPDVEKRIAIFNCRLDRPERSHQMGAACVAWEPADHYVLIGSGTYLWARAAVKNGIDLRKITIAEHQRAEDVFETIVGLTGTSALVMGMGNIGGAGLELVQYFRNRSLLRVS